MKAIASFRALDGRLSLHLYPYLFDVDDSVIGCLRSRMLQVLSLHRGFRSKLQRVMLARL